MPPAAAAAAAASDVVAVSRTMWALVAKNCCPRVSPFLPPVWGMLLGCVGGGKGKGRDEHLMLSGRHRRAFFYLFLVRFPRLSSNILFLSFFKWIWTAAAAATKSKNANKRGARHSQLACPLLHSTQPKQKQGGVRCHHHGPPPFPFCFPPPAHQCQQKSNPNHATPPPASVVVVVVVDGGIDVGPCCCFCCPCFCWPGCFCPPRPPPLPPLPL